MLYFFNLVLSLAIVIVLIPFFIKLATRVSYMDVPSKRKVHERPIPVLGGLAIIIGVLTVAFLGIELSLTIKGYILGVFILALFGMLDDYYHMRARDKFMGQILAALAVMFLGGVRMATIGDITTGIIHLGFISVPITLFLIVGMTNAINLADGLDGLAAGLSTIIFSCIAYMAYLFGETNIAAISVAIIGAILGFLRYNTFPAIVFMGDTGSQFLGFSAAVLSISLTQRHTEVLSSVLPILILGFPIIDTAMVMAERMLQKRPIFKADKNHFHHKLLRIGFYHKEAVVIIYLMQAFLVSCAFMFRFYSGSFLLAGFCTFATLIIGIFIFLEKRKIIIKSFGGIRNRVFASTKAEGLLSRYSIANRTFNILLLVLPLMLLISSFSSISVPWDVGIISLILLPCIGILFFIKRSLVFGLIEFATYYIGSSFIYMFEVQKVSVNFLNHHIAINGLVNMFFLGIAFLVVVYTISNPRVEDLQITPFHFLILFMLVVVPNLPEYHIQQFHLGPVITKIVVLIFGYDILFRRLRKGLTFLALTTLGAMILVSGRGGIQLLLG
jgi:UDP-GlcNAc:undecaprenyl-phosphate GlcNAc-1-phosphate transferase